MAEAAFSPEVVLAVEALVAAASHPEATADSLGEVAALTAAAHLVTGDNK